MSKEPGYVRFTKKKKERFARLKKTLTIHDSYGHPQFKKKHEDNSFSLDNISFHFSKCMNYVHLATFGWVRMAETFDLKNVKLLFCTISLEAGQWFISFNCEVEETQRKNKRRKRTRITSPSKGSMRTIDLGTHGYVDDEGNTREVPRPYRKNERKLRRARQSLSRKYEAAKAENITGKELQGRSNYQKQRIEVAKIELRNKNIREDWTHKYTTELIRENEVICIENLNVRGMIRNRCFAKSVQDAAFSEFARQLDYKAFWYDRILIKADRWFPSTKLCSECFAKTKQNLRHSVRDWICEHCGCKHHRDINAAKNLRWYAIEFLNTGGYERFIGEKDAEKFNWRILWRFVLKVS